MNRYTFTPEEEAIRHAHGAGTGGRSHLKPQWQRVSASIRRLRSVWKARLQPTQLILA
jgi:hypothetical protein